MTIARWLLGTWFGIAGFAGLYMFAVTPSNLPPSRVKRTVMVVTTAACLAVLAGLVWRWPPGWYAALLIQVLSLAEGLTPDKERAERPRWASRLIVSYTVFAVLLLAALCLPAARRAFGLNG